MLLMVVVYLRMRVAYVLCTEPVTSIDVQAHRLRAAILTGAHHMHTGRCVY